MNDFPIGVNKFLPTELVGDISWAKVRGRILVILAFRSYPNSSPPDAPTAISNRSKPSWTPQRQLSFSSLKLPERLLQSPIEEFYSLKPIKPQNTLLKLAKFPSPKPLPLDLPSITSRGLTSVAINCVSTVRRLHNQ